MTKGWTTPIEEDHMLPCVPLYTVTNPCFSVEKSMILHMWRKTVKLFLPGSEQSTKQ